MHEENNYSVTELFARGRKGNGKIQLINLPAMYQKQRNNASVSPRGKKKQQLVLKLFLKLKASNVKW